MKNAGICLITFSDNADHQNVVYSMYRALENIANVFTIGITNPKSEVAAFTPRNFYFDCPRRPGIEKETFRFDTLIKMAATIRKNGIRYLYFESQHIWNALLMLLCPRCISIQAIHDVVPHDGNRAMDLSNFVTSHLAHHVILRNNLEKEVLSSRYRIKAEKITCFELWREYREYMPITGNGVFLCFGRIRRYKGYDQLVSIIKGTPEIRYKIVGKSDKDSTELVRTLEKFENVELIDREVSDREMAEAFQSADWVLLPYASATQSGVIVDSYKYSRPIIAFDVGTISDQVTEGETGFLISQADTEAFKDRIRKVSAMSEEELQRMSKAAWKFGYDRYSAANRAKDFLNVILGINGKKS